MNKISRKLGTLAVVASGLCVAPSVFSQVTIGSAFAPSKGALLDIKQEEKADGSANATKGLGLPRVALKDINSLEPCVISTDTKSKQEHIGLTVYNTVNNSDTDATLTEGVYSWDGNTWKRYTKTQDNQGVWYQIDNPTKPSLNVNSNSYINAKIAVGGANIVDDATLTVHGSAAVEGDFILKGTQTVEEGLLIKAVGGADPVKIEGVNQGNYKGNSILTLTDDGAVKKIASSDIGNAIASETSIPVPNVYSLTQNLNNFLENANVGQSQVITNLKATKDAIKGMTFNESTSVLHFPPGIYQITVVYEAEHNTNCTLSSYFVDFPTGVRIHSTAAHNEGAVSNHGGSIIFTAVIPTALDWTIKLGRGQSGNCYGSGMRLKTKSTQISIFRIGEV